MSRIRNYFNELADGFDTLPIVRRRDPRKEIEIIETLIPHIRDESILDIGCGTGRLTVELKRCGAQAFGIDIADRMIGIAKSKDPDIFETADFFRYSPDRTFHNAISMMGGVFGIIEAKADHIRTTKNFFRKLNILLRVNGVAVIEFLNQYCVIRQVTTNDIEKGLFLLQESLVLDPNGFFEKAYTPSEITAIAEEFGFGGFEFFSRGANGELAELRSDEEVGIVTMKKTDEVPETR